MVKFISIILIISNIMTLASPHLERGGSAYGLVRRDTPLRPRTDRHNNPTAMIWTPDVESFFRSRGYITKKGDPFPDTNRYHTLDMTAIADPVKATIEYIDIYGFYTSTGRQRWEHTAMSMKKWLRLTARQKRSVIQAMYNKENLTDDKMFVSIFRARGKIKPIRKRKDGPEGSTPQLEPTISSIKKPVTKTIFKKAFTDKDIDEFGNIRAFTWADKYQVGDIIEIEAKLPDNAKEVYIYRGPNRTPKWKTTSKGYFRGAVEHIPIGKSYYIWLEKGKGIEAKIVITRSY
jgi:hypothetical protein